MQGVPQGSFFLLNAIDRTAKNYIALYDMNVDICAINERISY
jgi:hypothetical protein